MQEGEETGERERSKPKIFIYPKKNRRQPAPLQSPKASETKQKPSDSIREAAKTAEVRVQVQKPKMTHNNKKNLTLRQRNGRQGQTQRGGEVDRRGLCILTFFFLCFKSCGSERGGGSRGLNQKFTLGGGRGGVHNDKKMTTIPKSQIPKITERKALFRGRVNTEAIQDQDFVVLLQIAHSFHHISLYRRYNFIL